MPLFIVMCEVSGGVTGHRGPSPLKRDGGIIRFTSRDAAEAAAQVQRSNKSPYGTARYRYWVEEVNEHA